MRGYSAVRLRALQHDYGKKEKAPTKDHSVLNEEKILPEPKALATLVIANTRMEAVIASDPHFGTTAGPCSGCSDNLTSEQFMKAGTQIN